MPFDDLRNRTQEFGLRVIHLTEALPAGGPGRVIGNQLLRAGTSVGANYRAACRARSRRDFLSKLGITLEEADESAYWLELVIKAGLLPKARVEALLGENNELVSIFVASLKTARKS